MNFHRRGRRERGDDIKVLNSKRESHEGRDKIGLNAQNKNDSNRIFGVLKFGFV
jgi:hypothetical protein